MIMRHMKIIPRTRCVATFPDGVVAALPVDQFPVHKSNLNSQGFPNNDIALLRELSAKGGINNQRFEAAAARLNVIRSQDNSKKTIEELWQSWRPSWYQSPTEVVAFEEWYLSKYPFEEKKADETVQESPKSDDSASVPAVES